MIFRNQGIEGGCTHYFWKDTVPMLSKPGNTCICAHTQVYLHICCCSVAKSCLILCDPTDCSSPGFSVLHYLLGFFKFMSIESVMLSNNLTLCCPLLLCLQSFPASGSFPVSWCFTSSGQSFRASASVLPMNIQGWFSLGLTDLISLQSKGLKSLLQHHSLKASILRHSAFFMVQLSLCTWLLEKP